MIISDKNRILINRTLDTIDWPLIYKFYKLVNRSVGIETTQIPGLKKLPKGTKLKENHIKIEVECLINHLIENDLSQFIYGPWNFIWVNGEWEMEIVDENDENSSRFVPILESTLEVYFSPMVVISKETVIDEKVDQKTDSIDLDKRLEKAISEDNFELAAKIRDLIEIYKTKR